MSKSQSFAPLIALALSQALLAADLLVQPGNPNAFQTLQAALNAALPGDRVLIGGPLTPGTITISKSVTIESAPGPTQTLTAFSQSDEIRITALTPGIALTFRRLNVRLIEMGSPPGGILTAGILNGEIRFDGVDMRYGGAGPGNQSRYGNRVMVDLRATRVWFRSCWLEYPDTSSNFGCIDIDGSEGNSCLRVTADTLHLEDCFLRAGSANHLSYSCCFGSSPPNCLGQFATGGRGGFALNATTRNSTLVRCQLSDGNGGTVESSPFWSVPVVAGSPRPSIFGGQAGGVVDQFAVTLEQPQPGRVGAPYTSRGPVLGFGPAAPLSTTGLVNPGTTLGVTLNTPPGSLSAFLIGLAWGETATALGPIWVAPFDLLIHSGGGATQTYGIPPIPELRGIPIVVQAVQLFPSAVRTNPSGVAIR
jgi:hypothetical protein